MWKKNMTIGLSLISKNPQSNPLYRRDKVFNVIKMGFASKMKANLPIYGIKNKDLREFTTTEKDLEKGVSRIPLQLARIYEEDIVEEPDEGGQMVQMMEQMEILDNYTKVMEHRSKAYSIRGSQQLEKPPEVDPNGN